jgi:hypothetical protein
VRHIHSDSVKDSVPVLLSSSSLIIGGPLPTLRVEEYLVAILIGKAFCGDFLALRNVTFAGENEVGIMVIGLLACRNEMSVCFAVIKVFLD